MKVLNFPIFLMEFSETKVIFEEEYFIISCPETVDKHEVEPCHGDFISRWPESNRDREHTVCNEW